jgi:hypothetical protein
MVKMLKLPDGQDGLAEISETDPALRDMQRMSSSELRAWALLLRDKAT